LVSAYRHCVSLLFNVHRGHNHNTATKAPGTYKRPRAQRPGVSRIYASYQVTLHSSAKITEINITVCHVINYCIHILYLYIGTQTHAGPDFVSFIPLSSANTDRRHRARSALASSIVHTSYRPIVHSSRHYEGICSDRRPGCSGRHCAGKTVQSTHL